MESLVKAVTNETMNSTQLAELLGKQKKHINEKIRLMFSDEIEGRVIRPSLDSRGYVTDYHLPELESVMFVGKWHAPFLRQLSQYWIDRKAQPVLTQEQQVLAIAHQLIETTKQRDEAIKTKAHINDKRTATLMNRASQDSKKIKKLESKLQDEGEYKSVIAAELPQRVDTELKENVQTWRLLKQISERLGFGVVKVDDPRYGKVNTYHINVIAEFKELYL